MTPDSLSLGLWIYGFTLLCLAFAILVMAMIRAANGRSDVPLTIPIAWFAAATALGAVAMAGARFGSPFTLVAIGFTLGGIAGLCSESQSLHWLYKLLAGLLAIGADVALSDFAFDASRSDGALGCCATLFALCAVWAAAPYLRVWRAE